MDTQAPVRRGRGIRIGVLVVLLSLVVGQAAEAVSPPGGATIRALALAPATAGLVSLSVAGSPFSPDGDGHREAVTLTAQLTSAATLTVSVRTWDGALVRTLESGVAHDPGSAQWTWSGRTAAGNLVADGPYRLRVRATTPSASVTAEATVAKSPWVLFGPAPHSIVIAINPGHGSPDPGAVYRGKRESDMNLDIARRLVAMLRASGVTVVSTRTRDRSILRPLSDRNGDGRVNHDDELIARNDIANLARPDLYVTLMNNAYGCHCARGTETYTSDDRSWSPEGVDLARFIQAAHIARLEAFRRAGWYPIDRGIRMFHFSSLRPYKPRTMPRPTLMPSVLVESLFMDHRNELRTLLKPAVRTALAAAYFDGIARWLSKRPFGLRYGVLDATTTAPVGGTADVRLHLTNRGNRTSAGWVLQARMVPAVAWYDGSPTRGTLLAQRPIPDGLAPGDAVDLDLLDIPLPQAAGAWLLKLDVRLPAGGTMGDHGVVGPQLRITTQAPGLLDAAVQTVALDPVAALAAITLPGGDSLAAVPGPAGSRQWSSRVAWRRWVVRHLDIPPDSMRGTRGAFGHTH